MKRKKKKKEIEEIDNQEADQEKSLILKMVAVKNVLELCQKIEKHVSVRSLKM